MRTAAVGPNVALSPAALTDRDSETGLLEEPETRTIAAENTVFVGQEGSSSNTIASSIAATNGGGAFTANHDAMGKQLSLDLWSFGDGASNPTTVEAITLEGRVDAGALSAATDEDGRRTLFSRVECYADRGNRCDAPLRYTRFTLGADDAFDSALVTTPINLDLYPPHESADLGGMYVVDHIVQAEGGVALLGITTNEGGPFIPGVAPSAEQGVLWTSSPSPNGRGSIFRLVGFGGETREVVVESIEPGTGTVHQIPWGSDGRAHLLIGASEDGGVTAEVTFPGTEATAVISIPTFVKYRRPSRKAPHAKTWSGGLYINTKTTSISVLGSLGGDGGRSLFVDLDGDHIMDVAAYAASGDLQDPVYLSSHTGDTYQAYQLAPSTQSQRDAVARTRASVELRGGDEEYLVWVRNWRY